MAADEFTDIDLVSGAEVGEPPSQDDAPDDGSETLDGLAVDREANEADVVEQVLEVPYDEDYPETSHG